jgi:hypothetical protein
MGKPNARYVARAEPGRGWRVWDRKVSRWWGNPLAEYPEMLLAELNGAKRAERIVELTRDARRKRRSRGLRD